MSSNHKRSTQDHWVLGPIRKKRWNKAPYFFSKYYWRWTPPIGRCKLFLQAHLRRCLEAYHDKSHSNDPIYMLLLTLHTPFGHNTRHHNFIAENNYKVRWTAGKIFTLPSKRRSPVEMIWQKTRQAMRVYRNIEAHSCNNCCSGKAIIIIYSKCVSAALGIQDVMRMRHIVICGVTTLHNFFTLSHKGIIFGEKKVIEYKRFVFSLQLLSKIFLHLRRTEQDMITSVHSPSRQVPVILVRFQWDWIFSTDFKKYSNIKFHENPSSGSLDVPYGQAWRS